MSTATSITPETPTEPGARYELVEVDAIEANPNNHRKTFDPVKHEELTQSIREKGIAVPVMVRPVWDTGQVQKRGYQLVYGERRWRAAKAAGLSVIPAMVKELDDRQVLEVALIENCSREDIHPLEEGAAFVELHEKHGLGADEIAAKVGKSKSHVYQRMKLSQGLCAKARKAVLDGSLSSSIGLLIARIPGDKLQAEALAELDKQHWDDEQPSFRRAAEIIGRNFMLRLADADFDTKSTTLVAKAGACTACPKNTATQPELFGDIAGGNVCTDRLCFKAKRDAAWEEQKEAATQAGRKVISDTQAKKVFPYGTSQPAYDSEFVDLDDKDYATGQAYRKLAKGEDIEITLGRDATGKVHELIAKSVAIRLLRKSRPEVAADKGTSATDRVTREREKKAEALAARVSLAVAAALAAKVAHKGPRPALWDLFFPDALDQAYGAVAQIALRRALIKPEHADSAQKAHDAIERHYATMSANDRAGLVAELLLSNCADGAKDVAGVLKAYDVDPKKIAAEVKAKAKDEAKAAQKAKE